MKKSIYDLFKKNINDISYEIEYIYKDLIIVQHCLKRFKERLNLNPEILLALVIINYPQIKQQIENNKVLLQYEHYYIEIPLTYKKFKFLIVIRKDRFSNDKYVIKTVKSKSNLQYKLEKMKIVA